MKLKALELWLLFFSKIHFTITFIIKMEIPHSKIVYGFKWTLKLDFKWDLLFSQFWEEIKKSRWINSIWKIFVSVFRQLEFLKFVQENGKISLTWWAIKPCRMILNFSNMQESIIWDLFKSHCHWDRLMNMIIPKFGTLW